MGPYRRSRAFTLIEAMAVVVIVGILALLATVGYRRFVNSSHITEATDMVANIRTAEESFLAENGGYLDVSGCLGTNCTYPAQKPGAMKTAWGGPCGWCKKPLVGWTGLNVMPNAPLLFGYAVVADQAVPPTGRLGVIKVNGTVLDMTAMSNGAPWYVVEADANLSGDNTSYTHVYGLSGTNQLFVDGDGN